jgi:hypothetical protein
VSFNNYRARQLVPQGNRWSIARVDLIRHHYEEKYIVDGGVGYLEIIEVQDPPADCWKIFVYRWRSGSRPLVVGFDSVENAGIALLSIWKSHLIEAQRGYLGQTSDVWFYAPERLS